MTKTKTKTAKPVRTKVSVKTTEPSLVFEKPGPQNHTRQQAEATIRSLRDKVAKLYASGKFKNSMAMMVPLTHLDNATYYKSCGCFDRAVEICNTYESTL